MGVGTLSFQELSTTASKSTALTVAFPVLFEAKLRAKLAPVGRHLLLFCVLLEKLVAVPARLFLGLLLRLLFASCKGSFDLV